MSSRSEANRSSTPACERGQRLYCARCGSEIEIISPTTTNPPNQVLRCCGQEMRPSTGASVNRYFPDDVLPTRWTASSG